MAIKSIEELKNAIKTQKNEELGVSWWTEEVTISRELALELLKKSNS